MAMPPIPGGAGVNTAPGPNPMDAAADANAAPPGGPMSTPQPKEGVTQAAKVNVQMASKLLEQALSAFGSQTEEGKAILNSLRLLSKQFGEGSDKAKSLIPAELMQLMQEIPGAGAGPAGPKGAPPMPPGGGAGPGAGPGAMPPVMPPAA